MSDPEYHNREPDDFEVEIFDLPESEDGTGHKSSWISRKVLQWQRSLSRRSWHRAAAIVTPVLVTLAVLIMVSSIYSGISTAPGRSALPGVTPSTNNIRYFDRRTFRAHPISIYTGHQDFVTSLDWSPDGTRLASASRDGTVRIWDVRAGKTTLIYRGHRNEVLTVAWSPNGKMLASAGRDGTVQVWNAQTGDRKSVV